MLTPEEIAKVRADAGAPPIGQTSQPSLVSRLGLDAPPAPEKSPYDTGNPITSPSVPYKAGNSLGTSVAKAVPNLPTSVVRGGTDFLKSVLNIFNPDFVYKQATQGNTEGSKNTIVNLAKAGAGALEKGVGKITGRPIQTEDTRIADQVAGALSERYGSWENVKRTIAEDPAGILFDIATLLEGGGAALGKAGLKGAGEAAARAGKAVNPVRISMKAAGTALEKTGEAAAAPFAKSALPENAEAFKEAGITPPVSAITKSKYVQGAETLSAKSLFGQKVQDIYTEAKAAIEAKTNEIVERVKPAKSLSDENLGKTVQEGLKEYEQNFKVTEDKVYTEFGKRYAQAKVSPANTRDMLKEVLNQQGMDFYQGMDSRLRNMFDRLSGETPEIKKMRAEGLPEAAIKQVRKVPDLTFDELKATRTSIGEAIARDSENAGLKRVYGALSEDMQKAVRDIEPAAGKRLDTMNADYRSGKQKIESRIASSIEQSNPERIAQNLITRNSADTLRTVKEMIGENRFKEISRTFVRQMLEDSVTRGAFDVAKLKANLAKYDAETLAEIIPHEKMVQLNEAITELEKMEKLGMALKPGEKFSGGSQTAYLTHVLADTGRLGSIIPLILTGNWETAAAVMTSFGADYAVSKLFTSDFGRKFLTEGFPEAGKLGAKIREAANIPYLTPKNPAKQ